MAIDAIVSNLAKEAGGSSIADTSKAYTNERSREN